MITSVCVVKWCGCYVSETSGNQILTLRSSTAVYVLLYRNNLSGCMVNVIVYWAMKYSKFIDITGEIFYLSQGHF